MGCQPRCFRAPAGGAPGCPQCARYTNASWELVRNRHCWPLIHSTASTRSRPYDDDDMEDRQEKSPVVGLSLDNEDMWEEEENKARWNGLVMLECGDDNNDRVRRRPPIRRWPAAKTSLTRTHSPGDFVLSSSLLWPPIILPTAARKTKKKPDTTPDLHQYYHQACQVGSLAGVSKLWTSLGKWPTRSAMGKDLASE